LKICS